MKNTNKALKAFYGARDADNPTRSQEIFTPLSLVEPLFLVWGGIALDPCGHPDSPVSQAAGCVWHGTPVEWTDQGVPTRWDGLGLAANWVDKTYCNPPFARLQTWLEKAARVPAELNTAVLMPARLQRKWLRAYLRGRTVIALNTVTFAGYTQGFPQALLMVVQGPEAPDVAGMYDSLGLGEAL